MTESILCYENIFEALKKDPVGLRRISTANEVLMSQSMASMSALSQGSKDSGAGERESVLESDVRDIFMGFEDQVRGLTTRLFETNIICSDEISSDTFEPGDANDLVCQMMLDLSAFGSPAISTSCYSILFRYVS